MKMNKMHAENTNIYVIGSMCHSVIPAKIIHVVNKVMSSCLFLQLFWFCILSEQYPYLLVIRN